MPPGPRFPNRPTGQPDWYSPVSPSAAYTAQSGYNLPGPPGTTSAQSDVDRWDQYLATLRQAMQESSGWERIKLQRQYEDAEKGRQNAMAMAQLQADTSRYGTDVQRDVNMNQLRENARQFDQSHGLEMQKFGLDQNRYGLEVAKAYTDYASGPDTLFMMRDFQEGMSRVGQGLQPSPYGAQGQPQARGWEDFAALAGFGSVPAVANATQPAQQAGGGGNGAAGQGSDPRVKAAMGILKAIPPSDGSGYDDDDFAALSAVESVFRAARPGAYQRMRPGQQKAFAGGLNRLGYFAPDAIADMQRSAPGQRDPRYA